MKVKFKKLVDYAITPSYSKEGDAGLDLTAIDVEFKDGVAIYDTGIAVEIPLNYVGLLVPRSGIINKDMMLKNSLGIIDSNYRGSIKVVMHPLQMPSLKFYQAGDRVAQLIIMFHPSIELEESAELSATSRNEQGFGSTGN